jgi:hypothetical protein
VDKSSGRYKGLKSFGFTKHCTGDGIDKITENWINNQTGTKERDFTSSTKAIEDILNNITSHKLIGVGLVLGC